MKDLFSIQSSTDGPDLITDGAGSDIVVGGAGNDLVFGAYGEVYTTVPTIPIVPATQLPPLDPALGAQRNYPGGRGALEFTAGVVTGSHLIPGVVPGDHTSVFAGGQVALTQNADLQGNPDNDTIDAGAGNDVVMGGQGNDTVYGGSGDDNIIGGTGMDKVFGGTGEDGILGDDGLLFNTRNGFAEPLYGIAVQQQQTISLPGPWTGAVVNIRGELKDIVNLNIGHGPDTFTNGYADVIYGGLGDDWIHGGAGDDAISGSDALPQFANDTRPEDADLAGSGFTVPFQYNRDLSVDYWVDPLTGQKSKFYDPNNPRTKIVAQNGDDFILNFNSFDAAGNPIQDGKDWIFGDTGNDVLFGGTGHDRLWGGTGDDYLQLDDNLNTDGGLNDTSDDATDPQATAGTADFAYGGDGLNVLIANSGADRMFDWGGEFNSYIVPFARFGEPTIYRSPNPHVMNFLSAFSAASGADANLNDPNLVAGDVELGLFDQSSPLWQQNHGGPRDPQPGNFPKGTHDTPGGPEDDTQDRPLQTAAGSTPVTPEPPQGNGHHNGGTPAVAIQKDINAADPLHPTAAENANDPNNPRQFAIGTKVVWTYLVTNPGTMPLAVTSITDDAGTPTVPGDNFEPQFVSGDTNSNGKLDPGETWLYTSAGATYVATGKTILAPTVKAAGQNVSTGALSASVPGTSLTATSSDPAYVWGQANGEGLAPAFWKTNADSNGAVAWPRSPDRTGTPVYTPTQLLGSVFTLPSGLGLGTTTLDGALGLTGTTGANALLTDVNAGGFGWYIDPTPADDAEFSPTGQAAAGSPASGRMDLLTVVMHELGHVLGLGDVPGSADSADLMAERLSPGERRLPVAPAGPLAAAVVTTTTPPAAAPAAGPAGVFPQAVELATPGRRFEPGTSLVEEALRQAGILGASAALLESPLGLTPGRATAGAAGPRPGDAGPLPGSQVEATDAVFALFPTEELTVHAGGVGADESAGIFAPPASGVDKSVVHDVMMRWGTGDPGR